MLYAGVDIGGMNIKTGLVTDRGELVESASVKTRRERGFDAVVRDAVDSVKSLCARRRLNSQELGGIGVAVPGIIDSKAGVVTVAGNLGWHNAPLARVAGGAVGIECRICNDANAATLGEKRFGSGINCDNIVFITLGTGVGSGIIIDGKLYEGAGCAGAEAGHMIIAYDGEECSCGAKGCWEQYASATAFVRQTRAAIGNHPDSLLAGLARRNGRVSGRTAFEAASRGDAVAMAVVDRYIRYIACGLVSLSNVLHPDAFVIGGGISHEGDALIGPLKKYMAQYCRKSGFAPAVDVRRASLGNSAGTIGAAALVMPVKEVRESVFMEEK